MKPLHVGLLLVAGAIGGAVVLKVSQSLPARPASAVQAQAQVPAAPQWQPASIPAAEPVVAPAPVEPAPVNPAPAQRRAPKPPTPEPVMTAQNAVPEPDPMPAVPEPAPMPEPASPAPEAAPAPPPTPPPPQTVTMRPGTVLNVRLIDGLSSERNLEGDPFSGSLDQPLVVDGFVIAERGARVQGRVVSSTKAGKVKGVAALSVELTRVHTSDGQNVAIATDPFEKRSAQERGEDAAKVGGAAAVGAIIGAIAGGGKGAAIGAGVGGGAGAGGVLLTRGKPAALPSETRIAFRLREPVTITERR